jgi:hypothetical protein
MKPVGKPDAVVPPVRFDERRLETEPRRELRYRHRRKPSMTVHLAARGHRASRRLYVRPEGAHYLWREVPPGELSIDSVADERRPWKNLAICSCTIVCRVTMWSKSFF